MLVYIAVFAGDCYGMLKMYCFFYKTCDAIMSIKNEGVIPIGTEYRNFQSQMVLVNESLPHRNINILFGSLFIWRLLSFKYLNQALDY